jgi:hypothetical protein
VRTITSDWSLLPVCRVRKNLIPCCRSPAALMWVFNQKDFAFAFHDAAKRYCKTYWTYLSQLCAQWYLRVGLPTLQLWPWFGVCTCLTGHPHEEMMPRSLDPTHSHSVLQASFLVTTDDSRKIWPKGEGKRVVFFLSNGTHKPP